MELPDLLPKEFHFAAEAVSDVALFQLLIQQTAHLIGFFVNACEDETWCDRHREFFHLAIEWISDNFFKERISRPFAKRAVEALQTHYKGLSHLIPDDNFLMAGGTSEVLFYRVQSGKDPFEGVLRAICPFISTISRRGAQRTCGGLGKMNCWPSTLRRRNWGWRDF